MVYRQLEPLKSVTAVFIGGLIGQLSALGVGDTVPFVCFASGNLAEVQSIGIIHRQVEDKSAIATVWILHVFGIGAALRIDGATPEITITSIDTFFRTISSADGQIQHQQTIAARRSLEQMFIYTRLAICRAIPGIGFTSFNIQICGHAMINGEMQDESAVAAVWIRHSLGIGAALCVSSAEPDIAFT